MGRIPQLDILRALAILLVLMTHSFSRPERTGFMRPFASFMRFRLGWTGVDLFFVLSGFLIGGLLMAELKKRGQLDYRRFIIRRGFKIWPAYLVFVVYCFIGAIVRHKPMGLITQEMAKMLLQIQNYTSVGVDFLWSLAIEEHFYLLLPLVLILVTRRGGRGIHAIPAITACMVIGSLALRLLTWRICPKYNFFIHHSPSHLRMDSLMVGVFLAYVFHFQPLWWDRLRSYRAALLWAAAICLSPAIICGTVSAVTCTIGFTGLAIGYACLMVAFLGTGIKGKWTRPALFAASVGAYSYSIYLWHIDLGTLPASLLAHGLGLTGGLASIVSAILCIPFAALGGMLMARLIENPALAIRDRLFPRIAGPFRETPQTAVVAESEPVAANA